MKDEYVLKEVCMKFTNMNKRVLNPKLFVLLSLVFTLLLVGCGVKDVVDSDVYDIEDSQTETATESPANEEEAIDETRLEGEALEAVVLQQVSQPVVGDLVATLTTSLGDIKIKFFPEQAPKTVENFTTHAKNGYYDGLTFHRVMNDFMIQGGDPTGTGTGGESIWGGKFEDELSPYLFPYRGALCMANSGSNTNGSQFFLVQLATSDAGTITQMKDGGFPEAMVESYESLGGTPWLYGKHTVFGQIFEGIEVLDAIAAVETDANDKPLEDVLILSIDIQTIEN